MEELADVSVISIAELAVNKLELDRKKGNNLDLDSSLLIVTVDSSPCYHRSDDKQRKQTSRGLSVREWESAVSCLGPTVTATVSPSSNKNCNRHPGLSLSCLHPPQWLQL